jgi:acyl-coenzyme A synthetase/AMP-(fatty) acid ligase
MLAALEVRDALPKTAVGKIQKIELHREAAGNAQARLHPGSVSAAPRP